MAYSLKIHVIQRIAEVLGLTILYWFVIFLVVELRTGTTLAALRTGSTVTTLTTLRTGTTLATLRTLTACRTLNIALGLLNEHTV